MRNRRHADNFMPSQKSPIPLNRYDDFIDNTNPKSKVQPLSPEPRLVARALYNFVGQSAKELTFKKGDVIFVRRQIDKNWYEGEQNAMVGLFPANYVEVITFCTMISCKKKKMYVRKRYGEGTNFSKSSISSGMECVFEKLHTSWRTSENNLYCTARYNRAWCIS